MNPTALALLAYGWWGLVPAYWKQMPGFQAEELILFRTVLSALSLLPVMLYRREFALVGRILSRPRLLLGLLCSSFLIGFNWYLYIWAVANGHVVESSLGYFLNPLVNVALGTLVLHERLNPARKLACALAALGTAVLTWQTGQLPWISLLLALSFGFYGFTRKVLRFPTLAATFSETALLSIPAAIALLWMASRGALHAPQAPHAELTWMFFSGLVTTIPLLAFAEAAQHLPLSLMGFFQFFSPTLQFLLGIFLFHEPFGHERLVSFGIVWAGLAIFLVDLGRARSGFSGRSTNSG